MLNRKYFPFERNSYYSGKLLSAKDFDAEQRYFNDKRRFANRLLGGFGIVSGLGVVMADDTSVILQAGCAYDASGREIVVPETRVVKLSTVEGYDALTTDSAYLGLEYHETPADEVYAAMNGESGGVCHNKTREGYRLFLADESLAEKPPGPLEDFLTALTIYSDSDVTLTQYTPKLVARGSELAVCVELKKNSTGGGEYSFSYTLDAPAFTVDGGESRLLVSMSGVRLGADESASVWYTLSPKAHLWGGGEVAIEVNELAMQKDGESFSLNEKLECRLRPVEQTLSAAFLGDFYQKSMDKTLAESYDQKLWVARLRLFRQKSRVILDKATPAPLGQYAYQAAQLMHLRELERFYPGASATGAAAPDRAELLVQSSRPGPPEQGRNTACGVFDLGLGLGYSTKEPVFSEEIMHGLGKGPVYVEAGVEYITANQQREAESSEILLGNISLFAAEGVAHDEERIYKVTTGVKILPERGTFIVAALPKETSGLIALRIRWYAMRMTEMSKQIRSSKAGQDAEKYILLSPDTIVVPPKGTAHISPVFINMPTEACSFKLVDGEGGMIDNNGVYTAPAKEGVYEIRVETISDPSIYTHAFAIVTQKKKEQ